MKRFLAILLSIAMLCTVVPFGALVSADSENLIVNGDFETGDKTGWDVAADKITATAAKDGNYGLLATGGAYAGGSVFVDVEPNTTYIFSIDVKSPAGDNAMMYIKRLDADRDEVASQENPGISVNGTEWTTFTKEIDSGDAVILQLQLCCGWDGTDKYFDNASLVKKEISTEPSFDGYLYNGDFETGDLTKWEAHCADVFVTDEEAYTGDYSLVLGCGDAWAATLMQKNIKVEKNTDYVLSYYAIGVDGEPTTEEADFKVEFRSTSGETVLKFADATLKDGLGCKLTDEWTKYEAVFNTGDADNIYMKLFAFGTGNVLLIDDIKIEKKPIEPSFDGYLYNGDFETGDLTKWEAHCDDVYVDADAAYTGNNGLVLGCADAWAATLGQKNIKLEKNTDYVLSYYAIGLDGAPTTEEADFKIEFRATSGDAVLKFADAALKDGLGCSYTDEWTKYEAVFNSGDADDVYLKLFAFGTGNVLAIDDLKIEKKANEPVEPSFDGYITNGDFETGDLTGWAADGWCAANVAVTDAEKYEGDYSVSLTGGYTNVKQTVTLEANTDYVLTAYYKGKPIVYLKAVGNNGAWPDAGADWTLYTYEFNSGDVTSAELEISSADGTAYFDNVKIEKKASEPEEPEEPAEPSFDGFIYNGDFEVDGNWGMNGKATIKDGVGKDGTRGVELYGDSTWANGFSQKVTVKANTNYAVSFDYKGATAGFFVKGIPSKFEEWPDSADWKTFKYGFKTGDDTVITIEFNGTEQTGVKYIDNIVLVEVAEPSFDGYITNGDFETGDKTGGWEGGTVSEDAAKDGKYGIAVTAGTGDWNEYAALAVKNIKVEPNTDYVLTFDHKIASGAGMFVYIKDCSSGSPVDAGQKDFYPSCNADEWAAAEIKFNSGDWTAIYVQMCVGVKGETRYFDNVKLVKVEPETPDEPEEPEETPIVNNGDFETGDLTGWAADGWCAANVAVTDAEKYEGDYSVSLTGGYTNVKQTVTLEANTDYVLTAYYKGKPIVYLKAVGNNGAWPDAGADWTLYTYEFNSGDVTSAELEISSADGTTYFDNVKIEKKASEPEEPAEPSFDGFITNGDFEAGAEGWTLSNWAPAKVIADAAKEGSFGLSLGAGGWASAAQKFNVKANTAYTISFWVKGYGIVYIKDATGENDVETKWPNNYEDWTYVSYEFNSKDNTTLQLGLNCGDNSAYIDNVVIAEKTAEPDEPEEPEEDNLIPNGDFETGDLTGWKSDRGSVTAEAAKDGSFGLYAEGGTAYRGANTYFAVEPYTTYIISMDVKSPDGSNALLFFKPADEDGNPGSEQISKDAVVKGADWTHVEFEYATSEEATVYIQLCTGWSETEKYFDNVKAVKKVEEPEEPTNELVLNGGFETGDLSNWSGHCADVFVTNEESYSGDYAAVLGCADIWSNTLVQEGIAVKKNTEYVLTFYAIGVDGELTDAEADFKIEFRGTSDDAVIKTAEGKDGAGFSLTDDWTKYEFKFNTGKYDNIWLKLFSFGTGNVLLIDDIVLAEYVPEPSFDGYITNGDFEMGDLSGGWYGAGFISKDAAKDGEYGVEATVGTGAWAEYGGLENMIEVDPNTEYVLTFDHLSPTGHQAAVFIKGVEGTSTKEDLASAWPECEANTWLTSKIRFNSGKYDKIYIQLCVFESGGTRYYDNVSLAVYVPEPGEKENPYPVSNPMMAPTYIDIPANGSVYYQFNMNFFDGFTIAASGVTAIEVDGVKYTDKNEFDEVVAKLKATSLQSGLVGFFNETDEVTTLIADYSEPFGTMNNPFELDEGANKVNTEGAFEYFAAFVPEFNGELTIKANVGDGFTVIIDNAGEIIDPDVVDGKIDVTITVESYTAVMFIISTTGAATELDIELAGPAIGSEARPIWVFEPEDIAEIDLSNGAVYYLFDLLFDGTELFVTGDESAYVVVNGTRYEYDAAAGAVVAVLEDNDSNTLKVEIGSNASSALAGEVKFPEGNMYNPQVIVDGDVAIKFPAGDRWYAVYTALGDGTLTLTPAAAQFADIQVNVEGTENWAYLFMDELNDSVSIEVKAGDKVIIEFYGGYDEDYNPIDVDTTVKVEGPAAPLNGWVLEDGKWAFYVDDVKVVDTWMKDSKGWCYLGADGYWVTNAWVRDSVTWCYIGADGYCVTDKWVKDSTGWVYLGKDGRMVTNAWVRDSVGWCYVGSNGYCVTNKWVKDTTGWCYIGAEGRMLTNAWVRDSKGWCYVDANGYCVTNKWVKDDGKWYYMDDNGHMLANTSATISGKKYNFNASGVCTNP